MGFVKASEVAGRPPFKASFFGPQGSGKTFTALLFAEALASRRRGRIAFVDTENGTQFYAMKRPTITHPEPFDFDVLKTRSLAETIEALRKIDPKVHTCVVLDSMSHLWDSATEAWTAANPGREIALRDWGKIKRPYKDIMRWVVGTSCDVIICGRQKNVFEEDDAGKLKNVGVAMRAEGETQYDPDFCFRMALEGKRGEQTKPSMFVEKDRSGILAGKWIDAPDGKTLEPLFPFLGVEAPSTEDPEERAAKDGELLQDDAEKGKIKEEKSSSILLDMQAKIIAASDLAGLAAVAGEIKKLNRYVTESHRGVLRLLYEERRTVLVNAAAPQGV